MVFQKIAANKDYSGLVALDVNKSKLPNGIGSLVKKVDQEGWKLDKWVEPEIVNTKRLLYENDSDWILKSPIGVKICNVISLY